MKVYMVQAYYYQGYWRDTQCIFSTEEKALKFIDSCKKESYKGMGTYNPKRVIEIEIDKLD